MIALKSLKYFIYDICLNKLFEGFEKNLFINPKLYPGKKFKQITVTLNEKHFAYHKKAIFTGVTITAVHGHTVEIIFTDGAFFHRNSPTFETAPPERKAALIISSCEFEEY